MSDEAILHLTEEQLTFFADRERAVGYREGHKAALQQRTWVGLTDEDKNEILVDAIKHEWDDRLIVEQIEAKLKEKNT